MAVKSNKQMPDGNAFQLIDSIVLQLERAKTEEEIIQQVATLIHTHFPDTYLVISVVKPQENSFKILSLSGLEKLRKKVESLLGGPILAMEFPLARLSKETLRLNSNGRLNKVEGGIHSLALKVIPRRVTRALEQLLGIDQVFTMGMVLDQNHFGNLTLLVRPGSVLSPSDIKLIETVTVIITIGLQKLRARHQIRKDSERTKRIFEVVPIGIGMVSNRVIKEVNERICEITGYGKAELIDQSARLLYPTEKEYDRVGREKYQQLYDTGVGEIETVWKCRDGQCKNILLRSAPINPDDLAEGVLFTALDITQRKETELALSESEDRYRKLVEHAPMAILIHSQGRIEYANNAVLDLLEVETADALIGTNALALVHPDDRQKAIDRIGQMYKTGKPAPVAEERFISAHGKEITLQVAANIIQYKGAPASMVFALNVTDLKSAEREISRYSAELEETNVAKDKFFSIIAHDLKGPFNSILGFSDILFTEYDDYSDEERKHFIKNIASSARNTYRLLENLLEWSRAQTNRLEFRPEILELSSVINETILLLRSQSEAKLIHMFSAVEFNTRVFADENMVKTILRNLLSNAIKFSKKRGNIRIMERHTTHAENGNEMIEVIVKDDGVGMPPNVVAQLFRIDQMVKSPGTENEKGTGLGLILCKELVVRQGGSIWADSEPGKGSTLHFTLPKA